MRVLRTIGRLVAVCLLLASVATAAPPKKNVLFVAVDDLRIELACYGAGHMKTPNIDQLARRGLLFERAYCQQAICAASRISLLTSYRPDTTKIYDLDHPLSQTIPDAMSMPRYFKENGYKTVSLGKIYHHQTDDKPYWDVLDSCSQPAYASPETAALVEQKTKEGRSKKLKGKDLRVFTKGPAYECGDVSDSAYTDGVIADSGMGYTVRSGNWRYTEWRRKDGKVTARELYDHALSDVAEANLVDQPEHAATLERMEAVLQAGPAAARP